MSPIAATWDAGAVSPRWTGRSARVGQWTVVADATLYYVSDLTRRLSTPVGSTDPATLIASLLSEHGTAAIPWLEGDFAWIGFHDGERRLIAARDFSGKRPMHFLAQGDRCALASGVGPLLREATTPVGLDLTTIASVAGGMWAHRDATAYLGIRELRAGHLLEWQPGRAATLTPHWHPPDRIARRRAPLDDAAVELRRLLDAAVAERLAASGPTAVSLSGGWDSTAVFATARAGGADVRPVSISYPEGDPGREDDWITLTAARWGREPLFLDINDIPLFHDWEGEAARRDSPFAHAYEHWNRALARAAAASGASVLLDGVGGDQLFQCGDVYLADLLRTGQWGALAGQLRHGVPGDARWRRLLRWGVMPNLPDGAITALARLRRQPPPPPYLDRLPPRWFRRDFLRAYGVLEGDAAARPAATTRSHVLAETQAYLTYPFFPRVFALLTRFARAEGVELRSPLLDARVVRFAAARPWSDRADRGETKRLLRHAMRDRLPAELLAPRPQRTGTTNAYFLRELRRHGWPVAERLLPDLRMAALGIIEPSHLRRAWAHVLEHDDDELAARLFFTLQAELWLRTHLS